MIKTCRYSGVEHSSEINRKAGNERIYFLTVNVDPCNKGEEAEIQFQFFIYVVSLIESVLKRKNPENTIYLHSIITMKDFNVKELSQHWSVAEEKLWKEPRAYHQSNAIICSGSGHTPVPTLENNLTYPMQQLNLKKERLICNMLIITMLYYNSLQE